MDDFRVENYDAKEVEAKKQAILKRVDSNAFEKGYNCGFGCGCATVMLALGLFGLVVLSFSVQYVGGSGSWFVSILEEA